MSAAQATNIVLIGMRAAGKTTLGRELARRLGMAFADLDEELGRRAGRDVDRVLAEEGEAAFRRREREVLVWAAGLRDHVVATGGGAVLHEEAWFRLADTGVVVYLEVPVDELVRRAARRPRPSLTELDPEQEVQRLYTLRSPLYRRRAQFTIQAANADPILDLLNALRRPGRPRDPPCMPPDAPSSC